MTIKELVSHIADQEGKIKEVSVGNIREIIGIISDLFYQYESNGDRSLDLLLYSNGKRRANKKGKKK